MAAGARRKSAKKKKATRRSSGGRSAWTQGERYWDRVAARNGVEPIQGVSDLAFLDPEAGAELIEAIDAMRAADKLAREAKEKRKRARKRA